MQEKNLLTGQMKQAGEALANEGKTPLYFALGGRLLGIVAVADVVKPDSAEAIRILKHMGVQTVMLTGDNRRTAEAIAGRSALMQWLPTCCRMIRKPLCAGFRNMGRWPWSATASTTPRR